MLRVVKMLLKRDFGGRAFNSHGNYIVDHGKSWKNPGIVFLNSCGNPESSVFFLKTQSSSAISFSILCRYFSMVCR